MSTQMNPGMFSSKSPEWVTPQNLFDSLNDEFAFTLDAAATPDNAKCPRFFTEADDGLVQEWVGTVWCNPPYGRSIGQWVKRGFEAAQAGATVVMLIPARTDTAYWHDYVMRASEVRLLRGRLQFISDRAISNAPFPNALVVFRPGDHQAVFVSTARGTHEQARVA